MQISRKNITPYPFFGAMAIFISLAVVLSARLSASEMPIHQHTFEIEEIREPDEENPGQISLYCPGCKQTRIYTLEKLTEMEPPDPATVRAVVNLILSHMEPDEEHTYTARSGHAARNVVLAVCVLFFLFFIISRRD